MENNGRQKHVVQGNVSEIKPAKKETVNNFV